MAVHYNFPVSGDLRKTLALIFDTVNGHDHNGTNSKAVTTGTPADGAVTTAKLAANALAASAAGRAKMADLFFDAATVASKFGEDSFTAAVLLQLIQDGAFAANAATRALFADGIFTPEKLTAVANTKIFTHTVENLGAGDDIVSRVLAFCPDGATMTITDLSVISLGTAAVDDVNTAVIAVTDGSNTIVSKTYNNETPFPADGAVGSLGTPDHTHKVLAAGEKLTLSVTKGPMADLPAFIVQVTYVLGTE